MFTKDMTIKGFDNEPCRRTIQTNRSRTRWARWPVSRCMPGWRLKRTNKKSWSGCAAILSRPALSGKRLSLTGQGSIRFALKTPYRDGTTKDMFRGLAAVGNDVDRNGNIRTGSILIESMTLAGS